MAMQQIINEHQRLVVLRLLTEAGAFALNESILQDGLNAYGLDISRDALLLQLAWLNEQGLIKTELVGKVTTATLTGRGQDVATGRAVVPGVKRPRAGE
ncbi:ArsR family transcriptional regulator [Shewanella sp. DW31]|uniref:VpaChn25_0724 family phage protein n=1 Tax=Shewanella sp. DW31 TaxID=2699422 RepID=UPI0018E315FD|nr:ArsR family transcriptional regulator [Shewanella sp. DW31]MBI1676041.1 ArsR family transcriptional regulator [Shewanella sp. DW31]